MDQLEDLLMEHGIMKSIDESLVGKAAAERRRLALTARRRTALPPGGVRRADRHQPVPRPHPDPHHPSRSSP
jgi:hypothetical protein